MLQLTINGKPSQMPPGSTMADIVAALNVDVREIAMMRGDAIVARSKYAETALVEGDVIELVTFIGGG